jgi:DNA polymerase V
MGTSLVAMHGGEELAALRIEGSVPCGKPHSLLKSSVGEVQSLMRFLGIRSLQDVALFRAYGDSMVGIGIKHGNVLIVDTAKKPENGSVVVASVSGELTAKTLLLSEGGEFALVPENPVFERVLAGDFDEVTIVGVVISRVEVV